MQCPRCQQENTTSHKFCRECGTPLTGTASAKPYAEVKDENERLARSLSDALQHQAATSEILRAIREAQTNAQPVFEIIARSARRLCEAAYGQVQLYDGDLIHLAALEMANPEGDQPIRTVYPLRVGDGSAGGRAIATRAVVQIPDLLDEQAYAFKKAWEASGLRSLLAVPMLRGGEPLGTLGVGRIEPGLFPQTQIDLLQTFADQAVIAIENVRLFKELEARNRDLTEALEQQTATAEILRVISSSPTDVGPVFHAIVTSGRRLCEAHHCALIGFDGETLALLATDSFTAEGEEAMRRAFPYRANRSGTAGRAVLDRTVVHIQDVLDDPGYAFKDTAKAAGYRAHLGIPMFRGDDVIGVLIISRAAPGPFSQTQIELLRTFADQAVIAIENVRLFKELQERNRALTEANAQVTEALEQQTATSDILRVISQSQTDPQPVFETIVRNAVRLCGAIQGGVYRFDGELVHAVAHEGFTPQQLEDWRSNFPRSVTAPGTINLAIRTRTVVRIDDIEVDPSIMSTGTVANLRSRGSRSTLAVPMIRQGDIIGAIALAHREVAAFSNAHVELLKTFADQAVIAIENVRLFKELEARTQDLTRSVGELRALGEVGEAISSTLDLQTVLRTIVARATQLSDTDAGVIYEYDDAREVFVPRATEQLEDEIVETMLTTPVRKGEGATGQLAETQEAIQVPDILAAPAESRVRGALVCAGYRALLAVPLVRDNHLLGGLTVIRKATGAFAPEVIELLRTFATQSALAIQNARLFEELADKSRQLAAASHHKSEFLANMSHELRTPLNAVIGFSEVLLQRMFGELNEKQDEYLKDIYASGQHLLSLINDILDLSKIEAGRMELAPAAFHLPTALDNAVTLVKERAGRHGITLQVDIDPRLGEIVGDERKVKQVLLNLLSNAVKFTPERGRISLKASRTDGTVEIAVTDTGIGIAPEDQAAIFEEFRQVGSDETHKQEGTGLGLTLAKKFVELHGGRIWVTSEVGAGSTFTFSIPLRHGE
jgi:signal transduction histidine kinase